jgi:hypothetical protein
MVLPGLSSRVVRVPFISAGGGKSLQTGEITAGRQGLTYKAAVGNLKERVDRGSERRLMGLQAWLGEYKWPLLVMLEVLAWASTFFMVYARYRLQSPLWFKVGGWLVVLTGVIPQVGLGVMNFVTNREVDLFTAVLVLLIVYGLTVGKRHVRQLDEWARRRFAGRAADDK